MGRYPLKRIRRWKRRRLIAGKILFLILEQKLVVFVASVYKKHRVGQLPDFVQRRFFLFSAVP